MWNGPDLPHQELPPLPPTVEVETSALLKDVIAASRSLASLNEAVRRLPDASMLVNLLPILEAQASSEIENIVTTNDELFRAAGGIAEATQSAAVKEALRYREALWLGRASMDDRPLTTQTAIDICSAIHGRRMAVRNQPGTYIGNPQTRERIYTPPEGQEVILGHLASWERFLHADSGYDPLVVMAMQHYQFEAIHPFFDGNGRTGRVLNLLYLVDQGLLHQPVLYLSGHIVRTKDEYYTRLRAVTSDGDWEGWVRYMVAAVAATSSWTLQLVEDIEGLRASVEQAIREILPAQAPAADLARALFVQPYVRIDTLVEGGLAQRQTVSKWLKALVAGGILERQQIGRGAVFINHSLLDLFARATDR